MQLPFDINELTESLGGHMCTVFDEETYSTRLVHGIDVGGRIFAVCVATLKSNVTMEHLETILASVRQFLVMADARGYLVLDISGADSISLGQLKHTAKTFAECRPLIENKLVGTMIVADGTQAMIGRLFSSLYTPVRPIAWWLSGGDAVAFVREQEAKNRCV